VLHLGAQDRRRRLAVVAVEIVHGEGTALVPDGVLQRGHLVGEALHDENIRKYT